MGWVKQVGLLVLRAALVAGGVVLATFVLLQLVPGDVATSLLGSRATPEAVAELRQQLGLDLPWYARFGTFVTDLFTGGGESLVNGVPVGELISARAGVTLGIVALAVLFAVVISTALAVVAAANHDRWADQVVRLISTSTLAIPAFLVGMLLILLFGVQLRWFPVGGNTDGIRSLVLPSLTAALAIVPVLTRSLRVQLLEVAGGDFVAAARSAGFSNARVTFAYLLPNAAIPALTLVGLNVAYLVGGTFVVEKVFAIPGLGALMFDSISARDVPVIQGIVVYTAILVVVVNLVTDALVRLIDPRRRTRGSRRTARRDAAGAAGRGTTAGAAEMRSGVSA
ncbi:ABC transporter permease [Herbiconiux moechotypicola]|uniref:ABC transporter permease n=1 Tax=Herbiconiux moechotypicola TaxID=637393 RepID=A0ABN3D928_9MICO|nr:ABC transporter permease [Herbiconiux moechotypicola]MCS5728166.1 ABC transporter permease [Herbiconiux moechotypicola]